MGGVVPAFPEDNVIARVEGEPDEPAPTEPPGPAAPAPSRSQVPGVFPEPSVAPPPAPPPSEPEPPARPEPPEPVGAPSAGEPGPDGGDGAAQSGDSEEAGNGQAEADRPELSEASAAALRRVREQQSGGRTKRRKHGRNR